MHYVCLRYMLHVQKCVVCVSGALCELCDGITRDWKVVVWIDKILRVCRVVLGY
jgi:hypothetical protein